MLHILAITLAVLLSAGIGGQSARAQEGPWVAWAAWAAYERGDYAAALSEWRPLAEAGNAQAQFNLGFMYDNGEGVPQDKAEAVRWYRLAADQGHGKAQYNLGLKYRLGEGVPQDNAEATRWFRLAADQGHGKAQYNLGAMYANGDGVLQDNVQAHMRGNIACALGNENGCKLRDLVSKDMTPADISEAQKRARVCMESDYKDCD